MAYAEILFPLNFGCKISNAGEGGLSWPFWAGEKIIFEIFQKAMFWLLCILVCNFPDFANQEQEANVVISWMAWSAALKKNISLYYIFFELRPNLNFYYFLSSGYAIKWCSVCDNVVIFYLHACSCHPICLIYNLQNNTQHCPVICYKCTEYTIWKAINEKWSCD